MIALPEREVTIGELAVVVAADQREVTLVGQLLDEIIAESSDDAFDSMDELTNEIKSLLPRHAVGEPYQSEGEGD